MGINYNKWMRLHRNLIITIVVSLCIGLSFYFLMKLDQNGGKSVEPSTSLRFSFFLFYHAYLFLMMVAFIKLRQTYSYVIWLFVNCLIASLSFSICQWIIHNRSRTTHQQMRQYEDVDERFQLIYLNFYFLVFLYNLVGLFLASLFICLTEGTLYCEKMSNEAELEEALISIEYSSTLEDEVCAVCLDSFKDEASKIVQINKCKHIFHRSCIMPWLRVHQNCPTDRGAVFNRFVLIEEDEQT